MKKLRKYLIGLLAFCDDFDCKPGCSGIRAFGRGDWQENLRLDRRKSEGTAALSLGVYKDGEVIYKKHYGYIDVENKIEVGDKSIYEWGSRFQSADLGVGHAVAWGGKNCSRMLMRNYFSEDVNRLLKYEKPVSMRQLMNHQAGFQEVIYPVEYSKTEDIADFEELFNRLGTGSNLRASEPGPPITTGQRLLPPMWSSRCRACRFINM